MKIKVLIPVYNDWQSVFKLIEEINNLSITSDFQISLASIGMINGAQVSKLHKGKTSFSRLR